MVTTTEHSPAIARIPARAAPVRIGFVEFQHARAALFPERLCHIHLSRALACSNSSVMPASSGRPRFWMRASATSADTSTKMCLSARLVCPEM